jgi:hypothetical protein
MACNFVAFLPWSLSKDSPSMKDITGHFLAIIAAATAGVTARGQVHLLSVTPVNAVGYVNTILTPGFNLVSNPLYAADNKIPALFVNIQGGVVDGLTIYRMVNGVFYSTQWSNSSGRFDPPLPEEDLEPGDGVFVYLPGADNKVLTFVGAIPQGELCTTIPGGYSIKAIMAPQAISPNDPISEFPPTDGDILYFFSTETKAYDCYSYSEIFNQWSPIPPPVPVGHAFVVWHCGPAKNWCRTFDLNNP